jgi:hypothetical protein
LDSSCREAGDVRCIIARPGSFTIWAAGFIRFCQVLGGEFFMGLDVARKGMYFCIDESDQRKERDIK